MTTYDKKWHEVDDTSQGTVETKTQDLLAVYTVTDEGVGEYVTVKEYDNGGKDVAWKWTKEPKGEWHFADAEGTEWTNPPQPTVEEWWSTEGQEAYPCQVTWDLFTPYTKKELKAIAEQEAQAQAEAEEQMAQADMVAALPDAVAELSELAADNTTDVEVLSDAIAELSTLVAEILESNNG